MSREINNKAAQMEITISGFLKIGVILSALVILTGLIMLLVTGKSGYPDGDYPRSEFDIFKGLFMLKPHAVILTGLLLLILTPIFRVGVSIVAFFKEKDYLYVIITVTVFTILVIGFLLGKVL